MICIKHHISCNANNSELQLLYLQIFFTIKAIFRLKILRPSKNILLVLLHLQA